MAFGTRIGDILVSHGNAKLDKSIGIFSLPAIKTCPNCENCKKTCYARKAEKRYPNVLPCREVNLTASKAKDFENRMVALIKWKKFKIFRIHESGDFYSQEYADRWTRIAERCPDVAFWTYTKSPFRPNASNINVVESILPDGSLNYGKRETVVEKAKKFNGMLCPVTMGDKSAICGKTCKFCLHHKTVLFVIH